MVVQAIHQNPEGQTYLNLIIKDFPDQCLPADPSWVIRQLTISEATISDAGGVDADEGVRECAGSEGLNVTSMNGPNSDTGDTGSVLIEEDEPVKISQVTETNGHEQPVKFSQVALDISIGEPAGNSQLMDDGTEPVKFSQVIEVDAGTQPVKFSQVTLWLDPDDIIVCQNTQPRRGESRERIDEYAELMSEGLWEFERHPLPKVMLIDGSYYAVDVHHRQAAAAKAGKQLLCEVLMGTLPEARILAASFNTDHGVPYAAGDQRRRIEQVLDNLALMSDAEKAELFAKYFCVKGNKQPGQIEIDCRSYDAGWSSRNIARYLHLPESGYRTVCNIIKERDFAAELKRWGIEQDSWENRERVSGTRIEIIHHPDSTYIGETGQVWNASLSQQTLGISLDRPVNASSHIRVELDWIKKTDKPKPEKAEVNALTSAGYSSNSSNGYSSTESLGAASNSQVSAGGIPIVKSIAQENKEAQQRLGLGNPFQTEHGEDPQRCEGAVDRPSPAIEKFNSGKTLVNLSSG